MQTFLRRTECTQFRSFVLLSTCTEDGGRWSVGWQCEQQRCLSAGEWVRAARCSHAPCFLFAVADAAAADAVGGR